MKIPFVITEKIKELNELVNKYPTKIPYIEVSKFLGWDKECLARAIEENRVPFGMCSKKGLYSNRSFCIPTAPFYFWYTGTFLSNLYENEVV